MTKPSEQNPTIALPLDVVELLLAGADHTLSELVERASQVDDEELAPDHLMGAVAYTWRQIRDHVPYEGRDDLHRRRLPGL